MDWSKMEVCVCVCVCVCVFQSVCGGCYYTASRDEKEHTHQCDLAPFSSLPTIQFMGGRPSSSLEGGLWEPLSLSSSPQTSKYWKQGQSGSGRGNEGVEKESGGEVRKQNQSVARFMDYALPSITLCLCLSLSLSFPSLLSSYQTKKSVSLINFLSQHSNNTKLTF